MSVNRVVLVGRLTADPELRSTPSTSVLKIRLAFNERGKNPQTGQWEDLPNYINVTMFGDRAEKLSQYLVKGTRISVDGKLRWHQWQTKDGENRSAIEIIADRIEFMDPKSESNGPFGGTNGGTYPAPQPGPAPDLDEEIPF